MLRLALLIAVIALVLAVIALIHGIDAAPAIWMRWN